MLILCIVNFSHEKWNYQSLPPLQVFSTANVISKKIDVSENINISEKTVASVLRD
jgi:hypothetical protein